MASERALQELAKKLRHEVRFVEQLNTYFADLIEVYQRALKQTGKVPSIQPFAVRMEKLLTDHYKLVTDDFKTTLRSTMKSRFPVLEKKSLEERVDLSLEAFISQSIIDRAEAIMETTTNDMELSLSQVLEALLEADEDFTNEQIAEMASARMSSASGGRPGAIGLTETQNAAEGAKYIEAEAIAQDEETGDIIEVVSKVWETVGDDKVRSTHADADGQTVLANAPFTVGGHQLMYPGDTSRNAPLVETINCRCSSGYVVER